MCDETLTIFSTEKQRASEVLNPSRCDGQGSAEEIHTWREETLTSGCAHRPLLDQGLVLLWATAPGHKVRGASLLLLLLPAPGVHGLGGREQCFSLTKEEHRGW